MLVMLVVELFVDQAVVEGRLQWQLSLVQFRLVGRVLVRVATLLEVDVVTTVMLDRVREFSTLDFLISLTRLSREVARN